MTLQSDLFIVENLLTQAGDEGYPALTAAKNQLQQVRDGLLSSGLNAKEAVCVSEELSTQFQGNPQLLSEAKLVLANASLTFIKEQATRFAKIKSERELTADEKRFGSEHLLPLLERLAELFDIRLPKDH